MIRVCEAPAGVPASGAWRARPEPPAPEAGVYTTTRTVGGRPLLLAEHLARLADHAAQRGLAGPPPRRVVAGLLAVSGEGAPERRLRLDCLADGRFRMQLAPLATPAELRLWPAPAGSERADAEIKDALRGPLDALEAEARGAGADEAVLRRPDGVVTETTRSNLLFVDAGGVIVFPEGPALPGIALAWALGRLRVTGREIGVTAPRLEELDRFPEWIALSGVKGPVAVSGFSGYSSARDRNSPGPVLKYLRAEWARLLAGVAATPEP